MTRPIPLRKPPDETVIATFCRLTLVHVEQINTLWCSLLEATQESDIDWDWAYKLRLAVSDRRYEAYAIELDELVQGVMLLETQWHRSWLPERFPLVYVEYLASAPWNRYSVGDRPYLVGVGRTLLLLARQRSIELGYGGRIALHSLSQTEAFYRRNNMIDYGADPEKEGLVYFEYGALQC